MTRLEFIFDSSLDSLYFKVTLLISVFVLFDEVFWLQDSFVWVHLNHIHVHVLFLVDLLAGDDVADIDDALITVISVVIEPNVLCTVIGLVD